MRRYPTLEEEQAAWNRMEEFVAEAAKIDITRFSPRLQQAIREYEETVAAQRRACETDLEYLRRTRPEMTEDTRISYLWLCIIAGKSIKAECQPLAGSAGNWR